MPGLPLRKGEKIFQNQVLRECLLVGQKKRAKLAPSRPTSRMITASRPLKIIMLIKCRLARAEVIFLKGPRIISAPKIMSRKLDNFKARS